MIKNSENKTEMVHGMQKIMTEEQNKIKKG
jgi:hypothetical protein